MQLSPAKLTSRGSLSPSLRTSAEAAEIEDAIMRGNVEAVEEKLSNAVLSAETLQGLLKYALDRNSSPAIKKVLLKQRNCNPESALTLAVQYNDTQLAKQALERGADPEKITVNNRLTDDMRTLLTYARRLNKLYPPGAALETETETETKTETDLVSALRKGRLDDSAKKHARSLLEQAFPDMMISEAWQHAVKHKQLNMQRAILLLLADTDPYFRVEQDTQVTDKGVAEVMKEIPYFSPKRGWPKNFNCTANFPRKQTSIECRHLVEHRQKVQQQHPQGKFNDAQFASLEAIIEHVSYDTDANQAHLQKHATEVHLLHNRDFSLVLMQQLASLAAQGKLPQSKFIVLTATSHAMGVRLTVKEEDNQPRYVAEFFDPNFTSSHMRVASASLRTFETLTLENFMAEPKTYERYYPASENFSTMFVRPSLQTGQVETEPTQGAMKEKTLVNSIKDEDINATALWHMLTFGFVEDVRLLKGKIKIDKELLAAKNDAGFPALYMALQNDHADAIEAFGELLMLIPSEKERAELLAAKNAVGSPGLSMALQRGSADAIEAFGKLLELVPSEGLRAELLTAKDSNGTPGLWQALKDNSPDAIKAFGKLLKLLPPTKHAELLAAKNAVGIPGLSMALHLGHAEAAEAFFDLLELVPPKERAKLLAPKDAEGISGLAKALKGGKLEVLEQYIAIVMKTAPALDAQERSDLLKYIRKSHAKQMLRMWSNHSYYSDLKKQNPDFYLRFKEMKNALKS